MITQPGQSQAERLAEIKARHTKRCAKAPLGDECYLLALVERLERENRRLREALEAILRNPYGCPFCDSGTLRTPNNPKKDHEPDCGFAMARAALVTPSASAPAPACRAYASDTGGYPLRRCTLPDGHAGEHTYGPLESQAVGQVTHQHGPEFQTAADGTVRKETK